MSTSGSYSDESLTSVDTDLDLSDNYELEVEELESASDEASPCQEDKDSRRDGAVVLPYDDEPIADEEWVGKYEEDKEREKIRVEALQERLDGVVPTSHWCKCNNCGVSLLQNVYETQYCQEIERCVEVLCICVLTTSYKMSKRHHVYQFRSIELKIVEGIAKVVREKRK